MISSTLRDLSKRAYSSKSISLGVDGLNTRDSRRKEGEIFRNRPWKKARNMRPAILMRYALRDLPDPQDAHFRHWK